MEHMKKFGILFITLGICGFFLLAHHSTTVAADGAKFVGNKKCIGCHKTQFQSWKEDYHAKALDDLMPGIKTEEKTKCNLDPNKDYSTDASCLECHATGYGKPAMTNANLDNVGCESCHGPGSSYRNIKIMNKKKYEADRETQHTLAVEAGLLAPDEALCVTCHNDKSPTWKGFDFDKMIKDVDHNKE